MSFPYFPIAHFPIFQKHSSAPPGLPPSPAFVSWAAQAAAFLAASLGARDSESRCLSALSGSVTRVTCEKTTPWIWKTQRAQGIPKSESEWGTSCFEKHPAFCQQEVKRVLALLEVKWQLDRVNLEYIWIWMTLKIRRSCPLHFAASSRSTNLSSHMMSMQTGSDK